MKSKSSKKSPKVLISGYYGFDNCGDEAVLLSIVHCLKKLGKDIRIVVLSNNPGKTRDAYNVEAVNRWNPVKVLFELMTCRLLISGGGSLLQDVTSSKSLYYYLIIIKITAFIGKKVMIYSQGIGPLNGAKSRAKVSKAIDRCHMLTVRDASSAALLKELGVKREIHVVCDPVMALCRDDIDAGEIAEELRESQIPDAADENRKPLLMVAMRHWMNDEHIAPIAEFLDAVAMNGWSVLLVPAHFPEDMDSVAKLRELMTTQPCCIDKCLSARQFLALTARADMVLSMRLHGLVCAMAVGTPMIGFSYDPKVDGFMRQAGLEKYCLQYNGFSAETVKSLFDELNDELSALPPHFRLANEARRQEMQKLAWETAEKAAWLMGAGNGGVIVTVEEVSEKLPF